jgi:hypothetical protein
MRIALCLVFALAATPALANTSSCLNMRDVRTFDFRDAKTTVAKTRDGQSFEVRFAGRCGYTRMHPQLAFDQTPSGQCLAHGNLLNSYDGGACIVKGVTPLEAR